DSGGAAAGAGKFRTSPCVPQFHFSGLAAFPCAAGQALAGGAEGHAADPASVALEGGEVLAGPGIPQPHCPVPTAGQALAVGAEGHARDIAGVAPEGGELLASPHIPQPRRLSTSAGGPLPANSAE